MLVSYLFIPWAQSCKYSFLDLGGVVGHTVREMYQLINQWDEFHKSYTSHRCRWHILKWYSVCGAPGVGPPSSCPWRVSSILSIHLVRVFYQYSSWMYLYQYIWWGYFINTARECIFINTSGECIFINTSGDDCTNTYGEFWVSIQYIWYVTENWTRIWSSKMSNSVIPKDYS